MIVTELLGNNPNDKGYFYSEISSSGNRIEYEFETEDKELYTLEIHYGNNIASAIFKKHIKGKDETKLDPTKNYLKVFTTVLQICNMFNEKNNILCWSFAASEDEQSRVNFYKTLSKLIAHKLNYNFKIINGYDLYNHCNVVGYIIYKKSKEGLTLAKAIEGMLS